MRKLIIPVLLASCTGSGTSENQSELKSEIVDSIETSDKISEGTDMELNCGIIDSLDYIAFKIKDVEGEQNTYSPATLLDTNQLNKIKIGRHLLFAKNEITKTVEFNGKLITEVKDDDESTILFMFFKNNGIVPTSIIGETEDAIGLKYGDSMIAISESISSITCFEGYNVFIAFDEEKTVRCAAVFDSQYGNYFDENAIIDHIEEAIKIKSENQKH